MSIQKTINIISRHRNALVVSACIAAVGCTDTKPQIEGTPAQAVSARTTMNEGNAFVMTLGAELAGIVNRFQPVHPATQAFIIEPPVLPVPIVNEASITGWYGTHTETSPGTFTTVNSASRGILIELLNGINVEFIFDTLEMGPSVGPTGILDNFRLKITSNNRNITTPEVDKVGIQLDYNVLEVNASATGVLPAGMDTDGFIGYTRNGPLGLEDVIYDVKRTLGSGGNTAGATVNDGQFIRFRDISPNAGGREWQSVNQVTYENPQVGGPWVGKSASQVFKDGTVQYSGSIEVTSMLDYVSTGVVDYRASGTITFDTAVGAVVVGKLSGGPYSCDLNNPANPIGSGANIVMEWNDGTSQILMPTAQFNCGRVVAQ